MPPESVLRMFHSRCRHLWCRGSQRPAEAITYGVMRTLSKVVKMSHILRCYLSHVGRVMEAFDYEFLKFASDPRNINLGLASDGFNPFGHMSTTYSLRSPGMEIEVYLQPLIGILKELWSLGGSSKLHDGSVERRPRLFVLNGHEILEQLYSLEFPMITMVLLDFIDPTFTRFIEIKCSSAERSSGGRTSDILRISVILNWLVPTHLQIEESCARLAFLMRPLPYSRISGAINDE
ncbi:uncharacterized protein E5676_scaffold1275G00350 [Cucumis melo var. makuwa]|uniref:Uncharacterized protein n=1 Tax=Cucumis melo var. makuwa TaxID=1194695 RepID=A0A5D3CTU8_CUCMM|nr:uncharacterized protein E5676_scaffold1275G00350 [Cucumis melo var. makuwa]